MQINKLAQIASNKEIMGPVMAISWQSPSFPPLFMANFCVFFFAICWWNAGKYSCHVIDDKGADLWQRDRDRNRASGEGWSWDHVSGGVLLIRIKFLMQF